MSKLKKIQIWLCNLLGITCEIARFNDESILYILRSDGFVLITDGRSTDALPITFCNPYIAMKFEEILAPTGERDGT